MKSFTLDEFAAARYSNLWIRDHGLKIYVRKNLVYPGLYDLANITAVTPGQGSYSEFLDHYEDRYPFLVENCLTNRFAEFHRKRGWVELPNEYSPSFLSRLAVDRGLGNLRRALL